MTARSQQLKQSLIELLDDHRVTAIVTNRPDGWLQTTIVSHINDGFLLYCFVTRNSRKYANVTRDSRVSIAIGSDAKLPTAIKGLSLAAWCCPRLTGQSARLPEHG